MRVADAGPGDGVARGRALAGGGGEGLRSWGHGADRTAGCRSASRSLRWGCQSGRPGPGSRSGRRSVTVRMRWSHLDRLRSLVGSGEHDLDASADAFAVLDQIVAARLRRGLTAVVDTLGLDPARRRGYLDLARVSGMPAVAAGPRRTCCASPRWPPPSPDHPGTPHGSAGGPTHTTEAGAEARPFQEAGGML